MINLQEKLNSIINLIIEKNGYKEDGFWEPLINNLRNCELVIDYPTGYARNHNRSLIKYTFKTNDRQVLEELQESKKDLIDFCEELLEDDYELVWDEDGETDIFFKYDRVISKLPIAPKHTFEYCEKFLLNGIQNANHSIYAAVAWITNDKIMDALEVKAKEGVDVVLLVDKGKYPDDMRNFNFISRRRQLYIIVFPCENINSHFGTDYKNLMHHKFCIIDNKVVFHGTYNWTVGANFNDEDISKDDNVTTVNEFLKRFKDLRVKYNCSVGFNFTGKTFW